jgi:hypothetical protein
MAEDYPNSRFTGFDYHDASIRQAAKKAADAGLAGRVTFEVAAAADYPGTGHHLVTSFDSLHDMGNPVGAARHVLASLHPDGRSGWPFGAQAGEAAIREVVTTAGFSRFRRVAETPFNLVYEARP